MKVVCVTGCLGFMGSYFTRACLQKGWHVWGVDLNTYAANRQHLDEFARYETFKFTEGDIAELTHLYDVSHIFNFAAETHVDNSIMHSDTFLHSNVIGVQNLLELIRRRSNYEMPVLVHLSTDEVYGDCDRGKNPEQATLVPSNPYSASKAAADMLLFAWGRTYGIPFNIIRPTNNYGIGQYPEKLIPKAVKCLSLGKKIPLHAGGTPVRNWLHVEDTVNAMFCVLERGERGKIYNVAGNHEAPNLDVVSKILQCYFGKPVKTEDYVDLGYERRGGDMRYALEDSAVRALGFKNERLFDVELPKIVEYYKNHFVW